MKTLPIALALLLVLGGAVLLSPVAARTDADPVVRAVLFYSPSCPHCHQVINEVLLPMQATYGEQLQVLGIDTSQARGSQLYRAAIERYAIPSSRRGVPTLVVGDTVLVGGREIPDQFPSLVDEALAAGGMGWPDLPLLDPGATRTMPTVTSLAPDSGSTALPEPSRTLIVTRTPAPVLEGKETEHGELQPVGDDASPGDPVGFALAVAVLAGLVLSLGYSVWQLSRPGSWVRIVLLLRSSEAPMACARNWAIPLLALVGLVVASYLAYVEVTHVAAVCGPVGECNVVQTSRYALFLGVPVAMWGVLNYLAILALWTWQRFFSGRVVSLSVVTLLGLTLFGTVFSIYLTCLEIFVIRAVCMWCLGSAAITAALLLCATRDVAVIEE